MRDYKSTIFLPQTEFPMRGNLPEKEPLFLENWAKENLYQKVIDASKNDTSFMLHDGPPYANGHIHMGTALNKILKDIVTKSQYKLGKYAPYVPGWDCHGLPIEAKVEEQYKAKGKSKDDVPINEFRSACRDFAASWIDIQREEFKRLGVLGDWDNPYTTMTNDAEAEIVRLLGVFLMNGGLYRGVKPVMWSVVEKTALAEAEVEYKDHTSESIYVRFPITDTDITGLEGASAVIWTTTPWTLPGNRAIAYGNDLDYVALKITDAGENNALKTGDILVLARDLMAPTLEKLGITASEVLKNFKGRELKNTRCAHPLRGQGYDFDVPLLPGDHVTLDAGTGLVHTAPGHGMEDFLVGREYGLEVPETVSDGGTYYDHVPVFAGKHIYKVAPDVLDALGAHLLSHEKIVHSYPHSWRSKTPLIYRTTPQWFVSMDENHLRERALKAIDEVKWIPESSINRIRAMVSGRPDWCISRQRAWGVPITVFVNKKTGEPLRDTAVMERIVNAVKEGSSDVWYNTHAQDFLGPDYRAEDFEQVQDILDVWFDSGSTQSFVLKNRPELSWPADLYLEGSDQHRGWFQTSLLVSVGTESEGEAPYRHVMTHGFIVDQEGYKMSKSKGNTVAPQDIIKQMGADVLRLWVVGTDIHDDMRIGPDILKRQQDIYRRYRNTLRYLLGALDGFEDSEAISVEQMPELERWVHHRLRELDLKVRECNSTFDFQSLYTDIHHFCSVDLSAFYFDIRKDALYCNSQSDETRRAVRTTMDTLFKFLVKWLSPVLSFTAEEAWLARYGAGSVHLERFEGSHDSWTDEVLAARWETLRAVRSVMTGAIELKRAEKIIGSSLQAHVDLYVSDNDLHRVLEDVDLADLSITSSVKLHHQEPPQGAFTSDDHQGIGVAVAAAHGEKCERCWKIVPHLDEGLCERCHHVVSTDYAA